MEISDRVKQLIEQHHVTQADVSRATGIDKSQLCKLLSGKNRWNKDHIDKIADYFNLSPSKLLENKDKEIRENIPPANLFDVEILRIAHESLEAFSRQIPIKIINSRRNCIIQRLYEHYLIYQEKPSPKLAEKYFFSC